MTAVGGGIDTALAALQQHYRGDDAQDEGRPPSATNSARARWMLSMSSTASTSGLESIGRSLQGVTLGAAASGAAGGGVSSGSTRARGISMADRGAPPLVVQQGISRERSGTFSGPPPLQSSEATSTRSEG